MPSGNEWFWIIGCVAFIVLLERISRTPVWSRIVKLLGGPDPDYPQPALEDRENVLRDGRVEFTRGLHGGTGGRLLLTNRRIIWYEDSAYKLWPFKRISGEIALSEIAATDQGIILAHIFGGRRLWLRRRSGKAKALWVEGLDEWIRAIRIAAASATQP
ncbi:MAG: hypothetical protein E6J43_06935 [Chloroflexi bacterium]|nr:MAG: hypothetical protein E6J43_06935 [Chloroflexota bacterium]